MSTVIDINGKVSAVRVNAPKIERVTDDDLQPMNADKVVRILNAQTDALEQAYPQLPPIYVDFELSLNGFSSRSLRHGLNGAIRFWPVYWEPASFASNFTLDVMAVTSTNASTGGYSGPVSDSNTLVVVGSAACVGKAVIRVAPRGA